MIQFLLGFWDYVIVFLAIITVVVFIHEMGHYLVARANGVRVETFSIGFGPEVFGHTARSGTRWKISLLPLGGYVKMFGDAETPGGTAERLARLRPEERAVAFLGKRLYQRAAIVAAGPAANFLFGIVVLTAMYSIYGQPHILPVIGEVQAGSAAAEAGLQPGDRVLLANGEEIDRFQDLQRVVQMTVGGPITLLVERNGKRLEVTTHPHLADVKDAFGNVHHGMPLLGVSAKLDGAEMVRYEPAEAAWVAAKDIVGMISDTLTGVGQMIEGTRKTDELGGPLRIAKGAGQAAQLGFGSVVVYVVLLSINLGFINLFPVPLLDGGHLLFYGIEALLGRPLGPRAQEYGFRIGLFLVFALMLLATRNDLVDLKVWDFIKGIVS